jgi:membrane-bound lytic murein transglycosylase MltF
MEGVAMAAPRLVVMIVAAVMLQLTQEDAMAQAKISLSAIRDIESSGNARAYNKRSGATGMFQITQPVVDEFNQFNGANLKLNDMYDEGRAAQAAQWYLGERIPQMLNAYKIPVTEDNVLAAYNAGVGKTKTSYRTGSPLPAETLTYQKRYKRALAKYLKQTA